MGGCSKCGSATRVSKSGLATSTGVNDRRKRFLVVFVCFSLAVVRKADAAVVEVLCGNLAATHRARRVHRSGVEARLIRVDHSVLQWSARASRVSLSCSS